MMSNTIRKSIVLKLWLTIVAMVVFVFAILLALMQQFLNGYIGRQETPQLMHTAQMARYLVEKHDGEGLKKLGSIQDVFITYVPDNKLTTSHPFQSMSSVERTRLSQGEPVLQREQAPDADTMIVMLSVHGLGAGGVLVVGQDTRVLDEPLGSLRNITSFAMLLGIFLATGLAFVISKNLSRPLLQMNIVAEQMAAGNFSGEISVVTIDEVGRLGKTFNALARKLSQSIAALNVERDQLSSILNSLEEGVLSTDLSGTITLANPPAKRTLSQRWMSVSGYPEFSGLPSELQEMQQTVAAHNTSATREFAWQGRQLEVTMTPLYEFQVQTLRGTVAVLRDVSEQRRLDRLRKDFIANVSHELRTPLSMMQGYSEALLDEFGDNPEERRMLASIIHDETLRMRRLVNDLLDFAQLESGQFQMSFIQLDLLPIAARTIRKFQNLARDASVGLITQGLEKAPVWVEGDGDRLEQVFTNLVDNAIRHTPAGGKVELQIDRSQRHAQIRVMDTGTGISPEDLPYIWERFYKADKARTRGRAGIGLGLAITKHIVNEHGGDIVVASEPGCGTTFTVILPLYIDSISPSE